MRLEDLEYFVAAAEEQHLGRAALRLGVSQPALTKAVQRLERALGFALFDRHPKGLTLTAPAGSFYRRIRLLRLHLQDAVDEASDLHMGMAGTLRIGVAPAYSQFPFSPAVQALRLQRPAVRIQVSVALIDALITALMQGELDLAICALSSSFPPGLSQTRLFPDDLRVVVRRGHPLLALRPLTLADVATASWLLPRSSVPARRNLEARWSEHGLPPPRVAVEIDNSGMHLADLLSRSDLLALLSERSLATRACQDLVALPLEEGRWQRSAGYLTREGGYLSPLAARYLELLHDICENPGPDGPCPGS